MGYYVRPDRNPTPPFWGGWGLSILPDSTRAGMECQCFLYKKFVVFCTFYIEKRYFLEAPTAQLFEKLYFSHEFDAGKLCEK